MHCMLLSIQFTTNFDFLIPISLESYLKDLRFFKLQICLDKIICLKFQRVTSPGCKDIGI